MALELYGISDKDESNNIFLFGSHQWALYYWKKSQECGVIKNNSTLVHIDYHSDFLSPFKKIPEGVSSSEISKLIRQDKIRYDDFIKQAMSMNLISHILFCCKQGSVDPFKNFEFPSLLLEAIDTSQKNLILDIDLDFFIDNNQDSSQPTEKIIKEIEAINELSKIAAIVTITTSHDWGCWEIDYRLKIQELFQEHSIFNLNFLSEPESIRVF